MTESPVVSIYMPTKNRCGQLALAVDSVLRQTYTTFELIVVDDGSTDDTAAYLQRMANTDGRVSFIRNEQSKGACNARNQAILASTGEFITGLDDDDEFEPTHVEALVTHWRLLSEQGWKQSALFVQHQNRAEGSISYSRKMGNVDAASMFEGNQIGNQIYAPRTHYIEAGLFDEEMPAWQDLEFFYRVLQKFGSARLLDMPSYIFDVDPRPDRVSGKKKEKILEACQLMYKKHGNGEKYLLQKLYLFHVYADYYGFRPGLKDLVEFCRQGFWFSGYASMFKRFFLGLRG